MAEEQESLAGLSVWLSRLRLLSREKRGLYLGFGGPLCPYIGAAARHSSVPAGPNLCPHFFPAASDLDLMGSKLLRPVATLEFGLKPFFRISSIRVRSNSVSGFWSRQIYLLFISDNRHIRTSFVKWGHTEKNIRNDQTVECILRKYEGFIRIRRGFFPMFPDLSSSASAMRAIFLFFPIPPHQHLTFHLHPPFLPRVPLGLFFVPLCFIASCSTFQKCSRNAETHVFQVRCRLT